MGHCGVIEGPNNVGILNFKKKEERILAHQKSCSQLDIKGLIIMWYREILIPNKYKYIYICIYLHVFIKELVFKGFTPVVFSLAHVSSTSRGLN